MAFKVYEGFNGYEISIGSGRITHVSDLDEVKVALDHYFGNTAAHHSGVTVKGCPFCEQRAGLRRE